MVQEAVVKTIPQEKKCKKAKWLYEEALQISEKRREAKANEKRKGTPIWMQTPKAARRDKKSFLSDQWREIGENNRMGKTRDLFKKIGDIKRVFHARMGMVKDRNGMDVTEAEDIKKKWQEYMEELYKKILMTQITMMVWSPT